MELQQESPKAIATTNALSCTSPSNYWFNCHQRLSVPRVTNTPFMYKKAWNEGDTGLCVKHTKQEAHYLQTVNWRQVEPRRLQQKLLTKICLFKTCGRISKKEQASRDEIWLMSHHFAVIWTCLHPKVRVSLVITMWDVQESISHFCIKRLCP